MRFFTPDKRRRSAQIPPRKEAHKMVEISLSAPSHNPKVATSLTSPPPMPFLVRIIKEKKTVPAINAAKILSRKGKSNTKLKKIPSKAKGIRITSKMIYCSKSVTVIMSRNKIKVIWYRLCKYRKVK